LKVEYGIYSCWTHSIILRRVKDGQNDFVVGSDIAIAGQESSANLIPAILSIIFQVCAAEQLIEYPTLGPPSMNPVDPVDDEDGDGDNHNDGGGSGENDEPSEDSGGSSYEPSSGDQGSSPYGSPDASGKRAAHQNNMGSKSQKKQRSGNFAPVSWSSATPLPVSELQRQRWCSNLNPTGIDSVMRCNRRKETRDRFI
jgi:hypothetical protein